MPQIKDSWQDLGDESMEETLSLCDLVMNDDDHSNEYLNDDGFSTQEDEQKKNNLNGDLFEFFNEDFPASPSIFRENISTVDEDRNIIFCGRIVSYRENQQPKLPNAGNESQMPKCRIEQGNDEKKKTFSSRNSCLFPWKISQPRSFNKSRTFPSSKSTKESQRKGFNKSFSMPASDSKNKYEKIGVENNKFSDEKFDFSVKKVLTLASPVKSRWYLFAFGVGRFPMEIELKDMKMRQSRKLKAMKFEAPGGDGCNGGHHQSENVKNLWRLLKVLGWNLNQ